jgi:hypothetical protein
LVIVAVDGVSVTCGIAVPIACVTVIAGVVSVALV